MGQPRPLSPDSNIQVSARQLVYAHEAISFAAQRLPACDSELTVRLCCTRCPVTTCSLLRPAALMVESLNVNRSLYARATRLARRLRTMSMRIAITGASGQLGR